MARIVNVHHVDNAAFLKGNAECADLEEVVMVFVTSPTYAEVVERVKLDLKWMEPSDACELFARYTIGFGHHNRLKIMPIDSEWNWSAYKEIVAGSQDKSLELFATRTSSKKDMKPQKYGINPGVKFQSLLEFQMWIKDYAVKYHRPYKVVHSDAKVRYTVKCDEAGCSWVVRARPYKGGPQWSIVTCQSIHTCSGKDIRDTTVADDHRQLTSAFIANRVANEIKSLPTYTIKGVIDLVKELFGYKVKYGKAWKAKQAAFKILYGDWEEAYNRLPRLLGAMAARNPGTYHVVEALGSKTRIVNGESVRVFGRAFWAFGPSIRAFKHCRPVMAVDGTFLTGRFRGTLLVAIGHDAGDQLLPLAFALVTAENNDNWEWFMHLVRTKVIEPNREVCLGELKTTISSGIYLGCTKYDAHTSSAGVGG